VSKLINELMQDGIDKARQGERAAARESFEKVVELDDKNEKAWFWLASVTDDEARKKVALSTVLMLNPGNERAQKILDTMEASDREMKSRDEIIPGVSRRSLTLILGVGGAVIALALLGFLVVSFNNARVEGERAAAEQAATQVVLNAVASQTAVMAAFNATLAAITPTPVDLQAVVRTLPPTFTPTAAPTGTPPPDVLPLPPGLSGNLAVWAGRDFDVNGYLPVGIISAATGAFQRAGDQEGRDVAISPDGTRLVYTRFQPAVFDTLIEAINVNGTDPRSLDEVWRESLTLFSPRQPSYSSSGDAVVFVARADGATTEQIFLVSLLETPPDVSPVRQISTDQATYSQPAISPDGTKVVAIRDNVNAADAGTDIVIIDFATGIVTPLTNDRNAFIESSPQWSPDGTQIVFAAAPESDTANADIFSRFANGGGSPTIVARDPSNEVNPVFSPDGRYIAFSSNRLGNYDIYVYDQTTTALGQLTSTIDDEFVGGWR
jgi:Tol biopolymer transport system component